MTPRSLARAIIEALTREFERLSGTRSAVARLGLVLTAAGALLTALVEEGLLGAAGDGEGDPWKILSACVLAVGLGILACCLRGALVRAGILAALSLVCFGLLTDVPSTWIKVLPKLVRQVLFFLTLACPPTFGLLALRYRVEKRKGPPQTSVRGEPWGIPIRQRWRYAFESLNLGLASYLTMYVMILVILSVEQWMAPWGMVLGVYLGGLGVFLVASYLCTRYVFQGVLLAPKDTGRFLVIAHLVVYVPVLVALNLIVLRAAPNRWQAMPMAIKMTPFLAATVGTAVFCMISWYATSWGSGVAKAQLSRKWKSSDADAAEAGNQVHE